MMREYKQVSSDEQQSDGVWSESKGWHHFNFQMNYSLISVNYLRVMMLFWRWSSLGFATVFQTLWQIHTWFSPLSSVFWSYTLPDGLISVQSPCPSFTGALSLFTVVCTIKGWWWVSFYCFGLNRAQKDQMVFSSGA